MIKTYRRLKNALAPELNHSDLSSILKGMDPKNLIDERIESLQKLMDWIRRPTKLTEGEENASHIHSKNIRFKFFMQFIERNTNEEKFFVETLRELVGHGVAIRLYYLTGVSENTGFFSELADRIVLRILPHVYAERDLAELFRFIFDEVEDAEWFEQSYNIILPPILNLIHKYDIPTEGLVNDQKEALII